jgi:hypothetical protein
MEMVRHQTVGIKARAPLRPQPIETVQHDPCETFIDERSRIGAGTGSDEVNVSWVTVGKALKTAS